MGGEDNRAVGPGKQVVRIDNAKAKSWVNPKNGTAVIGQISSRVARSPRKIRRPRSTIATWSCSTACATTTSRSYGIARSGSTSGSGGMLTTARASITTGSYPNGAPTR